MVSQQVDKGRQLIVAQPNRSANWRTNQWLLAALALWLGLLGTGFALIGAWVILPFAGLELGALAAGLYATCRKLAYRHVLHLDDDTLTIEKGIYYPREVWRFPRGGTSISVELGNHPLDPPGIVICGPREHVAVGDFLNPDDSRALLELLRSQGLRVRNHSTRGHLEL